jgi:hypothetical protein
MQESGEITNDMLLEMNFDTVRLQDVLNRLGPNIGLVNQAVEISNEEWAEQDALMIEAQKRFNTVKSQLVLMKNAFVDLGIEIFDLYSKDLTRLIKGIGELFTKFKDLDDSTKRLVVSIGLFAAALGPIMIFGGTLLQVFGILITNMATFSLLFVGLTGTLGALALAWQTDFGGIQTIVRDVAEALQNVFNWLSYVYKLGTKINRGNLFSGLSAIFEALSNTNIFTYFFRSLGMGAEEAERLGTSVHTFLLPYLTRLAEGFQVTAKYFAMFKDALMTGNLSTAIGALFSPTMGTGETPVELILHAFGVGQSTIEDLSQALLFLREVIFTMLG